MRTEQGRIEPDTLDPDGDQTSILSRRHTSAQPTPATEKEFTGVLPCSTDVLIDRLPRLFSDLEPNRVSSLPLANGRPIDGVTMRRDVLNLESDDIACT